MNEIVIPNTRRIDDFVHDAQASGALMPIDTESRIVDDAGLPFMVKWVSSLAAKPRASKPGRRQTHNPFAIPEPELTFGDIAPRHRLLLNKFPVMPRHLLIVTRDYEAQEQALNADDFAAMAPLIALNDGLGFYNGGAIAGASQAHKHLQWIPQRPPLAQRLPDYLNRFAARFAFRHALGAIPAACWHDAAAGQQLEALYRTLLRNAGVECEANVPAPYNLLLTREWMWLVPRRAEHWRGMSINALGFSGSLFVKHQEGLGELVAAGPMNALCAVACPR